MILKKLTLILFVLLSTAGLSFGQSDIEMADVMRSNGKIYVVVAVAAIVMFGILVYLVMIDRKLSRLESKVNNSNK